MFSIYSYIKENIIMKKLIGIFVMLMITLSIFGQNEGVYYNVVDKEPMFMSLVYKNHFQAYIAGDRSSYKNFEDEQYWFNKNDTYYLVSYDTTSIERGEKTRKLWLFKWTGDDWVEASDAPLQYDYVKYDGKVWSSKFYHANSDKGGGVYLCEDGKVMIVLTNVYMPDITKPNNNKRGESVIILVPIKDGNYHVSATMTNPVL